ncbi:hypothetical protein, partial [Acinetobacter baumannii]|uniref:hypothetical protein n=2 Tax=Acinetobacter baumannii TaxID=470 RepID=UPI001BB469A2
TSYPSCNLNFSNLGKLYLQRLYATKPFLFISTLIPNINLAIFLAVILSNKIYKKISIKSLKFSQYNI